MVPQRGSQLVFLLLELICEALRLLVESADLAFDLCLVKLRLLFLLQSLFFVHQGFQFSSHVVYLLKGLFLFLCDFEFEEALHI